MAEQELRSRGKIYLVWPIGTKKATRTSSIGILIATGWGWALIVAKYAAFMVLYTLLAVEQRRWDDV
jgi:hypothetical protein